MESSTASEMSTWNANEHRVWADGYEAGLADGYGDGYDDGANTADHGSCKLCTVSE